MQPLANPFFLSLKAGAAVALAIATVNFIGVRDQISATFVALVCISPTVFTGIRRGIEQFTASLLGGAITLALLFTFPRHPLVLGLAMALTVRVAFSVGYWRTYLVAGFTVLYMYILPFDSPTVALEQRMLSVMVGIASSTLVNLGISAFSYRSLFTRRLQLVREALDKACRQIAEAAGDPQRAAHVARATDPVFAMLSALEPEVGDFVREGELRGKADPRRAFQMQARALARAAHYVKELAFHLESHPHSPELVPALEAVRAALRGDASPLPSPPGAPEWAADAERAVAAARAALPPPPT
ncbi:MAG: aromatic acid exporter family protein [Myxococcales bacterium]